MNNNNDCFGAYGAYSDAFDSIFKYESEIKENEMIRAKDMQVGGKHYKEMSVQPWDVIDSFTREQRIGFYRGNAIKYIMRMGTKDECMNEIKKARHYLDKLIEVLDIESEVD
jgi:hypothetical protein